jgi:hypothetical protein
MKPCRTENITWWTSLLIGIAAGLAMASAQAAPLTLLAHYGFEGDARDTTGNHFSFQLSSGAGISNGVICMPTAFGSDAGTPVLPDLSYRAFTVAVDFKITEFVPFSGNILSGGPSYRWFGLEADGGILALRLSVKGGSFFVPFVNVRLQSNQWYQVAASVDLDSGQVGVFLNGIRVGELYVGAAAVFNVVGTSSEPWDKVFSFRNHGNASTLVGCADNLQIYSRAASDAEVAERIAPRPGITSSGGTVLISAPRLLTGYKLQTSGTLTAPLDWRPASPTPVIVGDHLVWPQPAMGDQAYFRFIRD